MANPSLADVMRLVQAACERDAARLDSTPFTRRGVGETFGATLAMVKAVARACEVLAEKIEAADADSHAGRWDGACLHGKTGSWAARRMRRYKAGE